MTANDAIAASHTAMPATLASASAAMAVPAVALETQRYLAPS